MLQHILTSLGAALGLVWLALILVGVAYTFARGDSRRAPKHSDWWDLSEEERDTQLAFEQARREYAESLRPQLLPYSQPVRDELLKLAGKAEDRRRATYVPRDAA